MMRFGISGLILVAALGAHGQATVPGDVNGDSAVNAVDVQVVINAALGNASLGEADLNRDMIVNAIDVQLIINIALGLDVELPEAFFFTYEIVNVYPHDPNAFTQGLVMDDGVLYEGTGIRGESSLREVNLETGEVLRQINLDDRLFGEGITVFGDEIFQLTWQANMGFVYTKDDFVQQDTFTYPTEGWGITTVGDLLIMSDGTDTLYWRDPETFALVDTVAVRDRGTPVVRLNELEYIEGEVWANVWLTDDVVRIDPATGEVVGRIDFSGLLTFVERIRADVLNGIAYDEDTGRIFVTGKDWPKLFEVRIVPAE